MIVTSETRLSAIISAFAREVIGKTSVVLNAVAVENARKTHNTVRTALFLS